MSTPKSKEEFSTLEDFNRAVSEQQDYGAEWVPGFGWDLNGVRWDPAARWFTALRPEAVGAFTVEPVQCSELYIFSDDSYALFAKTPGFDAVEDVTSFRSAFQGMSLETNALIAGFRFTSTTDAERFMAHLEDSAVRCPIVIPLFSSRPVSQRFVRLPTAVDGALSLSSLCDSKLRWDFRIDIFRRKNLIVRIQHSNLHINDRVNPEFGISTRAYADHLLERLSSSLT